MVEYFNKNHSKSFRSPEGNCHHREAYVLVEIIAHIHKGWTKLFRITETKLKHGRLLKIN